MSKPILVKFRDGTFGVRLKRGLFSYSFLGKDFYPWTLWEHVKNHAHHPEEVARDILRTYRDIGTPVE